MSVGRLNLCLNCLQPGASGIEVGPDIGTQRDPYRESLQLCEPCRDALLSGDFATLADRQADERTVKRSTDQ